jgi:imidazolonepropionase-like amidohydrolase
MGVDEIIRDTFDAALAYRAEQQAWERGDAPLRRNLRLDAALEILDGIRRVHVHSYRQDEILAFIRLAQEYSLEVAAFQHVLEGYKVAPEIAGLGAGASTFSDWWGFKVESIDAIPFNGALMRRAGVVVSFNSDDDELATRLNTEAAKAVRYGGVPEADALGFVTINPAIQLGIDDRVGSLEPGKDADFVIWNGHPLATSTRAEQTWIEGRRFFDIALDTELRAAAIAERARLIQRILGEMLEEPKEPGTDPDSAPDGERLRGSTDLYGSVVQRSHAMGDDNE